MSYEELEDIFSKYKVTVEEIYDLRRRASVLADRLRDVSSEIRRLSRLYEGATKSMFRAYGRLSWAVRRGLTELAKELRAEAEVWRERARGYRISIERLERRRKEIQSELGRIGARIRVLEKERREYERRIAELGKKYPYVHLRIGVYMRYPHFSGRAKWRARLPRRMRWKYRRPSEKMETWEAWLECSIKFDTFLKLLDERTRDKVESILWSVFFRILGEELPEILSYNYEFAEGLLSRAEKRGIDVRGLAEEERIPELYLENVTRKYRPPKSPVTVEWDAEEIEKRVREETK